MKRSSVKLQCIPVRVQRSSGECSVVQLGSSVAQMVVRWLAVRQTRVRISARSRHPMEVPPTEPAAVKIWRRASANVVNE